MLFPSCISPWIQVGTLSQGETQYQGVQGVNWAWLIWLVSGLDLLIWAWSGSCC